MTRRHRRDHATFTTLPRTAARRAALDAEGRALRRLPYRRDDVLAEAVAQSLADADGRRGFALS